MLCTLLWLLSAVTKKYDHTWLEAFLDEINIFKPRFLHNSLFDLAIVALLRMLMLLFCYAWIKCDHWLPVAFTTTVTTIFIGIKIFYFFDKDKGSIQQYLVIIASICVAWFELWLMPFRVLDREQQRDVAVETGTGTFVADSGRRLTAQELIRQIVTNEEELFQTAMEEDSSDDNEDRCKNVSKVGKISRRKCKEAIARAQNEADFLIGGVHSWKVLQKGSSNATEIRLHEASNSYYVKTEFRHTPKAVFNAVWRENQKWNTQVLETRIIAVIDSTTDIVITVTKASGGGYIAPRHFIDIRRFIEDSSGNVFIGAYVSVESAEDGGRQAPEPPAQAQRRGARTQQGGPEVRARNGVNMIRISRLDENRALFEWIMNTDLRLTIPRMLIRRVITGFFVDYTRMLAAFLDENPTGIN